MSSARSRGSGLRRLVLGGAVAVSSFSLSGCWAAVAGAGAYVLHNDTQNQRKIEADRRNTEIIAEAMRRAESSGGNNYEERTDFQMPTDRKISHLEFIEMLQTHRVSPEKISLAKLANVAYDPLFGHTMSPICNYGIDLNNNNKVEGPEELFGLDSQLIEGDPILIGMGCDKEPGEVVYTLFDARGNKVDELKCLNSINVAYNHSPSLKYPERDEPVRREIKLGSGRYLATFYSGANLITSREFTIVPKQQGTVVADKKDN